MLCFNACHVADLSFASSALAGLTVFSITEVIVLTQAVRRMLAAAPCTVCLHVPIMYVE